MFKPENECINHLNVYSKSKSRLGRLLTNFAKADINTPDGKFMSVEGYWYWMSIPATNPHRDELRCLSGYAAKKRGRELRLECGDNLRFDPEFEEKIRLAVRDKLAHANPNILNLPEGYLPLAHYYVTKNGRVIDMNYKFGWLTQIWQEELEAARLL